MENVSLLFGACEQILPSINDKVNLVLTDLPYQITNNPWDSEISLDFLWNEWKRILVPNGAVVLTASQPFTTTLISSNKEWFKYTWVWNKINRPTGHLNAKKQPLRITEDVVVFYKNQPTYNPQMTEGKPYKAVSSGRKSSNYGGQIDKVQTVSDGKRYPQNILNIKADNRGTEGRIHPCQKSLKLMNYLILTYTNPGDMVLDCTMGSGTTGLACYNLDRKFIGIEKDEKYFKIATDRIENVKK